MSKKGKKRTAQKGWKLGDLVKYNAEKEERQKSRQTIKNRSSEDSKNTKTE